MKILNFGSMNIDKIYHMSDIVKVKETLPSIKLEEAIGGKGLNQSIALSKTGIEVFHAGKVGRSDGMFLVDALSSNGINIDNIFYSDSPSGHAIIQISEVGENAIIVHGGANQEFTTDEIDTVLEKFTEHDWVIIQNEISNIPYIITKAKEKGMNIVFNPSPINLELFDYPLELVDIFVLNEVEGNILTDKENPEEIIGELKNKFKKATFFLTLGKEGSITERSENLIKQPAFKVNAVDPTGAGDTYTGYLIGLLAQGKSLQFSMKFASAASALSVTVVGASNSIPSYVNVEEFLRKHSSHSVN